MGPGGQGIGRHAQLTRMNGGRSIHCVELANGSVAVDLRVMLRQLGEHGVPLAEGRINGKGVLNHPALMSAAITAGGYEVCFAVGEYYRSLTRATMLPGFLEDVPYHFHITDAARHYHLPFKFTAWGFSLFRGSA